MSPHDDPVLSPWEVQTKAWLLLALGLQGENVFSETESKCLLLLVYLATSLVTVRV